MSMSCFLHKESTRAFFDAGVYDGVASGNVNYGEWWDAYEGSQVAYIQVVQWCIWGWQMRELRTLDLSTEVGIQRTIESVCVA